MKYALIILMPFFFMACNNEEKEVADRSIIAPAVQLSPLQAALHDSLIQIITKDIEHSGNKVNTIELSGLEVMEISKKEYYQAQLEEQEINFTQYLTLMEKLSKTNSPMYKPTELEANKQQNNVVMNYLRTKIKTATTEPELYKAVYYVKATAGTLNYNQQQTTFLDKAYNKIATDYSFLK